ncbi:FecR family protein [Emticicia sp. BO119]|uniref:FecR family protein n=1 Tax=Emticicia sp. BO119 TaxID=2757768 RepID=UPI0015F07CA5|nr:FecR domain-containing protein [Emticicia sp. BO119]MBA4853311.1 FecR domain-containing protein [Emticicia sp. BO119]
MDTNHSDNNEGLLGKYLAQETDAHENALIEKWLQENEENTKELNDYAFLWNKAVGFKENRTLRVDVDAAWLKVRSKIDSAKEAKVILIKPAPKRNRFFTIGIAASITILIAVGVLAYLFRDSSPDVVLLKTTQNTLEQILPDGSVVFLNANTILTYPREFKGATREINLSGEAFFDVKRNKTKPFIIHANGSDIKVLGTSFNIRAYNKNVELSVETGKVQFQTKTKAILLVAGEQATFEAKKDTIKKQIVLDRNVLAYKTKVFVFENSSLEHIAKVLGEGYHVSISLKNNRIKICRLTTKFDNETLPDALNIIAETLNLTISSKGGKYVLDGEGCNK